MSLSALDILRRGRERIARDGWVQGAYGDAERGWCVGWNAHSALGRYDGTPQYSFAYYKLADAAGDVDVGAWNDAPGRTVEQVLDAYDRAIAALEAER